jgi:CheY-like chemotaxis protein
MNANDSTDREPPALRILVVEDNADGREMTRLLLELLGHEVLVAADGQEGVEKGLQWRPDVAVIDIGLPRLSGYEVARRLRRELGHEIFLITQTGYGRPEDRELAFAAGFDVHLTKPVDPVDLVNWLVAAGRRFADRKLARASAEAQEVKAPAG